MIATQPGWQVIGEAANGIEALFSVIANRPDVILMDVAMPKMNGLRATRKIKTIFPAAKVILFSAYADRGYKHGSKEAGADFFVQKEELTAHALRNIIDQVLGNSLSAN
jgi:DNA-binding NarL/FixJ family response regulator